MEEYRLRPIGFIHSELKKMEDAPMFYTERAPDAWLELLPAYLDGLDRMQPGDEIIVITWLHLSDRDVLNVHPRGDLEMPLTGVFSTRSPDRPNPIGLHRARVLEIDGNQLHLDAMEAIDGTPVLDIKPAVVEADDS